ncbi:hypothetical protein MCP1_50049 [Candidatus Terasakiella magnetica]|nr:hypothetical protein MCP1_50049 [Candidatus Terasakiella magnetica]
MSTFNTVTGTWVPSSVKILVMPTFWAMRPDRIVDLSLELNLDVDASGQVELHERINGLGRRIDDVQETLVRTNFELLARLLVDVRATVDGELLDPARKRDRSAHLRPGPLGGIHDLAGGLIQHAVIEGLEADADVLAFHVQVIRQIGTAPHRGADRCKQSSSKNSPKRTASLGEAVFSGSVNAEGELIQ